MQPSSVNAEASPPLTISYRTVFALCATEMVALGSLAVPGIVGLAIKVRSIDHGFRSDEVALSVVAVAGAATAMLLNPIFGLLSDRTRTTHRGPWILGGILVGAVVAPGVFLVDSITGLVVLWCLMQASYNPTFAALYGTIADVVPEQDRSRVSGFFAASIVGSTVFAMALVFVLPNTMLVYFTVMPLIAVPVAIIAYRHLRTLVPLPVEDSESSSWRDLLRGSGQYWWVWLQRLLTQLAHGIVLMFGVYFLMRRVGMGEDAAANWVTFTAGLSALLSIIAAVIAGRMAARRGSYGPYLVFGISLIVVALVMKSVATTAIVYHVSTLLVGIGIGCYFALDLALVLRTIPARRAGAFLGFFNIARTLPQSLAPALAPLLLALGSGDLVGADRSENYFALYAFGIAIAAVALLLLIPIKVLKRPQTGVLEGENRAYI